MRRVMVKGRQGSVRPRQSVAERSQEPRTARLNVSEAAALHPGEQAHKKRGVFRSDWNDFVAGKRRDHTRPSQSRIARVQKTHDLVLQVEYFQRFLQVCDFEDVPASVGIAQLEILIAFAGESLDRCLNTPQLVRDADGVLAREVGSFPDHGSHTVRITRYTPPADVGQTLVELALVFQPAR